MKWLLWARAARGQPADWEERRKDGHLLASGVSDLDRPAART